MASTSGSVGSGGPSHTLPVDRVADAIRSKVFESRVTLIIGQTGTGKSSRVPQMLQEELNGTVLCTQPRRLAVVAIAKRVAQETGCVLGQEVGYRIGQKSVASNKTKILFTTAGLLLEELRNQGSAALRRVKCVICDEVHERSTESDLLLASVHALMRNRQLPSLKLVLMSATADVDRYRRHFSEDQQERVVVVDIPDVSGSLRAIMAHWLHSVKEEYLEAVVRRMEAAHHANVVAHRAVLDAQVAGHSSPFQQIAMPMQSLIRDLVLHLDHEEAKAGNDSGVIMVFLPTYKSLELQYSLLRATGAPLDIYPLHSSIDVDECIRSMEAEGGLNHRKIILATNVAESSVTIRGVCHVIDSCVSNQITWDPVRKTEAASVVWASQSQCRQRAGRCGRTCSGTVHRVVPRRTFMQLPRFETPAVQLTSLRREALLLISSEAKEMSQAQALLAGMMDPPDALVVSDALEHLVSINAAQRRGRATNPTYEPTQHGRFLAALPVSLDSALLVARGGLAGLLWEATALAAIASSTPYPIQQPFGADAAMVFARQYAGLEGGSGNGGVDGGEAGGGGDGGMEALQQDGGPDGAGGPAAGAPAAGPLKRDVLLLANLAAYEFWQKSCRDAQRMGRLADGGAAAALAAASDTERAWCEAHRLNLSSLLNVAETQNIMLGIVHKFRPCFLHKQLALPEYFLSTFEHTCSISAGMRHCSLAGVAFAAMHSRSAAAELQQLLTGATSSSSKAPDGADPDPSAASTRGTDDSSVDETDLCRFFLRGHCSRGAACPYVHVRPVCRFYLSRSGCRNGAACFYRHEQPGRSNGSTAAAAAAPAAGPAAPPLLQFEFGGREDVAPSLDTQHMATQLLTSSSTAASSEASTSGSSGKQQLVLLVGEGDLSFCEVVAAFKPSHVKLVACTLDGRDSLRTVYGDGMTKRLQRLEGYGATILHNVDVTALPRGLRGIEWQHLSHVVFNFPLAPGTGERGDDERNAQLMARFFAAVGRLAFTYARDVRLHVALCLDQYARWGVEAAARESFFFLDRSQLFKPTNGYSPVRGELPDPFPLDRAAQYRFRFMAPKGLGFELQARIWTRTEKQVAEAAGAQLAAGASSTRGKSSSSVAVADTPIMFHTGAAVVVRMNGNSTAEPLNPVALPPPPAPLPAAVVTPPAAESSQRRKRRGQR